VSFSWEKPGLDNIDKLDLLSKEEFEKSINFEISYPTFLVTFHPVTLDNNSSENQFKALLKAFDKYPEATIIFTKPNADTNGRVVIQLIDQFTKSNEKRTVAFTSLGQLRYLSALSHVDIVIGNSSSGLIEAPSFKVPTVNIGDRQKGRIKADSVISCAPATESITDAIEKSLSKTFQENLKEVKNPYGKGGASDKILKILKQTPLDNIVKKSFYDLNR
jgi:GDP/UDP-N,N'-diacetylbacillosamine 2-epimerase (hydrolysing)